MSPGWSVLGLVWMGLASRCRRAGGEAWEMGGVKSPHRKCRRTVGWGCRGVCYQLYLSGYMQPEVPWLQQYYFYIVLVMSHTGIPVIVGLPDLLSSLLPRPPKKQKKNKHKLGAAPAVLCPDTVLQPQRKILWLPNPLPGVLPIGAHSVWAGFWGRYLPATPAGLGAGVACCDWSSHNQSVSSALLVAELLPGMVVPDH